MHSMLNVWSRWGYASGMAAHVSAVAYLTHTDVEHEGLAAIPGGIELLAARSKAHWCDQSTIQHLGSHF